MRFYPAALALSCALAMTASVGYSRDYQAAPRAVALQAQGNAKLEAGDTQAAIDLYEAALAVDPGYTALYVNLADAARADGLEGKAIKYYREALERDPKNYAALSGEGEALIAKGARDEAAQNLAKLQTMCGDNCTETRQLAAALESVEQAPVMTAEAVLPEDRPSAN